MTQHHFFRASRHAGGEHFCSLLLASDLPLLFVPPAASLHPHPAAGGSVGSARNSHQRQTLQYKPEHAHTCSPMHAIRLNPSGSPGGAPASRSALFPPHAAQQNVPTGLLLVKQEIRQRLQSEEYARVAGVARFGTCLQLSRPLPGLPLAD